MSHILLVVADYYKEITNELVTGAKVCLEGEEHSFDILTVPGAFEIPAAISIANECGRYDGFIALGCVIRGETSHYDYVCGESARGLQDLAINKKIPIGYGILTVENMSQAKKRASVNYGNKGKEAAVACLTIIEIKKKFS
jgi:6,7-dimethyl-8-ribityllumazine synthase